MKEPSALPRGRCLTLGAVATGLVTMVGGLTVGCTPSGESTPQSRPVGQATVTTSSAAPASAAPMPYLLSTHCGIDEARIGDTYYEADHPLVEGAGDPPAGWRNPEQPGTMTVLGPTRVVFRDDAGHEVYFHARPGATAFKRLCD